MNEIHNLIPGGAHTYSRGDDQYPLNAPPLLSHGQGCYVWDADGRKFLDYGMALRAVTVGYGYEPIANAAIEEIRKGNNLTRASVTELKAAKTLTEIIPGAEMVKFAKNGSTVTTAAVKLARAFTGRKYVALCAQHPFFSYDDWFIGTTVMNKGVPEEITALSLKFNFNDLPSLEKLFNEHPGQIAAVILEPATNIGPKDNFLHKVQDLCKKNKTVFILDEMITGFRWHLSGAQKYFNITADLSTFGKGMANGFSVAALVGKREIMNIGGILDESQERVFLISTTHGAEMCGLGALNKTIEVYKELDVVGQLWKYGEKLISEGNKIANELGIADYFFFEGYPCSPGYVTKDKTGKVSLELRTLFSQEMLKEGVLIPWIALCYSHSEKELEITLGALRKALKVYSLALEDGVEKYLLGRPIKPVFRKMN
ncbi:MAG: glutamate-1-semialdehyde 2,1-aminomutase [Candidatus Riflebacteria bacterium]|nr:glutamate-1-semialdehyde 2,1-aminomutase [Candidatus Riflebacteria bacterium]